MTAVSNLESHWATYVVRLPHAMAYRTPQAALECAVSALGCADGDVVLVVGEPPAYVRAVLPEAVVCRSLADLDADRAGAVGVVFCHATESEDDAPWYSDMVSWCMEHGLWIIEDCGVRLDVGRRSHVAVWSLVGGIAACLDDRVARGMAAHRAREGWGMSEEDAVRCVAALERMRGDRAGE